MTDLERDLRMLVIELKAHSSKYCESKDEDVKDWTKGYRFGKKESYNYSATKISQLLDWHGVE